MKLKPSLFLILLFLVCYVSYGQAGTTARPGNSEPSTENINEKDLGDVLHGIFNPKSARIDEGETKDTRLHFTLVPAIGYTLQTGFAGLVSANMAFNIDTAKAGKISSINTSITYSQYSQIIIPLTADIWTKGNKYNIISDLRYISYPSDIYGLGGRTDPNKGYTINFSGIKVHETLLRSLSGDIYVGVGYYFDKFLDVQATDSLRRGENRQLTKQLGKEETASGPVFRFLYDSRLNQINPQQGSYFNLTYRSSMRSLGSDSNWQSLLIDARTYLHFPRNSNNVLAFWMLDWLTADGTPPYLLLPSTGWDETYNTGRGYIQGRFRGRHMLYAETEYRFHISSNGLFGGVLFANLQNFSSDLSTQYSAVFAGYGLGLRIMLNKHSGANLCVDYGFGRSGSHGFFVNLGEVF